MAKTIVGILRGGTSSEYNLSLKTGAAMLSALPEERYETRDILIDKKGLWHLRGIPMSPARALAQVDVVLNGLHGGVGEDGTVARLLERTNIPYTGSAPLQSGLALNKIRARQILVQAGVHMPRAVWFSLKNKMTTADMARIAFARFPPPYVVKPPLEGASYGILYVPHLLDLPEVIGDMLDRYGSVLVEEYINGREATVGIIEKFRRENLYALPPTRIIVPERARWIESSHHENAALHHFVPSDFSDQQKKILINMARQAHSVLGLRHFSRADFIVAPRQIYLLEVNALPGLYSGAAFPEMLDSVGVSTGQFLEHAISLTRM